MMRITLFLVAACFAASQALAQDWPSKPVRFIVPFPPGGSVDPLARLAAARLGETLKQQFVVENRPGAGGSVATELLVRAAPDSYTMLTNSSGVAITPSLMKLSYDPRKDIMPVTLAVVSPGVMVVHPSLPVKSIKDFIAFAKARPGCITAGAIAREAPMKG